jgi:site-specific recombinase XerD
MTKAELINVFKTESKTLERRYSDRTINTYLEFIDKFIDSLNGKDVSMATERDVRMFLFPYNERSESTYNLCVASLRTFFDILSHSIFVEEDYITKNPMDNIRSVNCRNNTRDTYTITVDDYHKIVNGCKNPRDKAIVTCLMNLGLREHELIALTVDQYLNRGDDNEVVLTVTKGSKQRVVYLNNSVCNAIDEYLSVRKESEYDNLFISNGGKPMSPSCIYRTLKVCAKRGGLDDETINILHPHTLRASCATINIQNGVPITVVASMLGHSTIDVTFSHYINRNSIGVKETMLGMVV